MNKLILMVGAALIVIALVVIGTRDIRRYTAQQAVPMAQDGDAGTSGTSATPGAPAGRVETIQFVKNPVPLPEFTISDIEGKPLKAADWRGKVVLVNFWATWCSPCREEIPDLVNLQKKYDG